MPDDAIACLCDALELLTRSPGHPAIAEKIAEARACLETGEAVDLDHDDQDNDE